MLRTFEKYIVLALLAMMMLAVLVSAVELAVILGEQLLIPPKYLLDLKEILEVFGFFLMVLIGLELLETLKAYLDEDKFHVEVVFLVAMVAIARKVIIMDYLKIEPAMMIGMAAVIIALSVGYYFVKKAKYLDQKEK
jgi:uncharacterized membrane protein (DUF373 family)